MEVAMKKHIMDKTNWRKMLSGADPGPAGSGGGEIQIKGPGSGGPEVQYLSSNDKVWELNYPVRQYPAKIESLNFDKDPAGERSADGHQGAIPDFRSGPGDKYEKIRGLSGPVQGCGLSFHGMYFPAQVLPLGFVHFGPDHLDDLAGQDGSHFPTNFRIQALHMPVNESPPQKDLRHRWYLWGLRV
jgi:hypothetical protein